MWRARSVIPPHTYVAGLFDTPGAAGAVPALIPAAEWLKVRILLPGGPLVNYQGDVSSHRTTLDMRQACCSESESNLNDLHLRLRGHTMRLVSLSERAVGLQLIQLEFGIGDVPVTLRSVV